LQTILLFVAVAMDVMLIMGAATGPVGWALNVLNFGAAAGFAIWAFKQKVPKGPIMEGFGVVSFHPHSQPYSFL
jgi:hypothetical protein